MKAEGDEVMDETIGDSIEMIRESITIYDLIKNLDNDLSQSTDISDLSRLILSSEKESLTSIRDSLLTREVEKL